MTGGPVCGTGEKNTWHSGKKVSKFCITLYFEMVTLKKYLVRNLIKHIPVSKIETEYC